jgi:hypothetical protein
VVERSETNEARETSEARRYERGKRIDSRSGVGPEGNGIERTLSSL